MLKQIVIGSWMVVAMVLPLGGQTVPVSVGRVQRARELVQLAEGALAKSSPKYAGEIRADLCVVYGTLGDVDAAKKSAATLPDHKLSAQLAIARLQGKSDKPGAIQYLHSLGSTWTSSEWDLTLIAGTEADVGDFEGARQLSAALKSPADRAEILSEIGYAQAKGGDLAEATHSFDAAKALLGAEPNTNGFNLSHIAIAQMQGGDSAGARATAAAVTVPRDRSYMLRTFAMHTSDKAAAHAWLDEARKITQEDQAGRLIELTLMAKQYAAIGDGSAANVLLTQTRGIADDLNGAKANPTALSTVAAAQRVCGDVAGAGATMDAAMLALERVSETRNRLFDLWIMSRQQAEAGDFADAENTIRLALKIEMDPGPTTRGIADTARAFSRGQGEKAELGWISRLATPDAQALVYTAAAAGLLETPEGK